MKIDLNKLVQEIVQDIALELTKQLEKGGTGSGNFGHEGRPGLVGGSSDEGSGINALGGRVTLGGDVVPAKPQSSGRFNVLGGRVTLGGDVVPDKPAHTYDGKYLHFPNGGLTSIPSSHSDSRVQFSDHRDEELRISQKPNGEIYGEFHSGYDKSWKTPHEFVSWLNSDTAGKQFEYVGIDDI
jgi:hypothetical protein